MVLPLASSRSRLAAFLCSVELAYQSTSQKLTVKMLIESVNHNASAFLLICSKNLTAEHRILGRE